MTRDDVKKILMKIQVLYPNWTPKADLSLVVDTWHEMLAEYEYKAMMMALNTFVTTNTKGFAPDIGQLIECTRVVENQTSLTETQAWELVSKALRNSYYNAEEQFSKLPETVQRVVGSPTQLRNWGQAELETVETVIQSNFMRTYRIELIRENQRNKMPAEIKNLIEKSDLFVPKLQVTKAEIEEKKVESANADKIEKLMKKLKGEMKQDDLQ